MSPKLGILRSRVFRRILAVFALSALLPLAVFALFNHDAVREELARQSDRDLKRATRSVGQMTAQGLRAAETELQRITADFLDGRFGRQGTFGASFDSLSILHEITQEVQCLKGEAQAYVAPSSIERAHLDSGRAFVRSLDGGGLLMFSALDHERLLVGDLRPETLWNQDGSDHAFFVLDESKRLLFSSFPEPLPYIRMASEFDGEAHSGYFDWEADDDTLRVAFRSLFFAPEFLANWTVCAAESHTAIHAPLQSFQRTLLLVASLTFWVTLLLSVHLIRRTLGPIVELRAATERLAADDFSTPVRISSGDEFEDLGASFNSMTACILDRTTKLQHATQVKMNFLANMSHELRTPMTAILGYIDICRDANLSDEERSRLLDVIARSGTHLLRVINDVLDVSQLESGRASVELVTCRVQDIVEDVLHLLRRTAEEKGLHLVATVAPDVPKVLLTDPTRLRQILVNLMGNSIKFSSAGDVSLQVTRAPLQAEEGVLFSVTDTGIGMSEEQLDKVFERFVQADNSTTRKYGGTGLGLSIASSLAELLSATLSCTSKLGEGSTFSLHHPLRFLADDLAPALPEGNRTEDRPRATAWAPDLQARVLLVEDVVVNRKVVALLLRRAGILVDEAENGLLAFEQALQAWSAGQPYHVILMDMQMPVMDGYEATSRLRAAGYRYPISALTAHAMADERDRCLEAGCDAIASKPIDQPELFRLIEELKLRALVMAAEESTSTARLDAGA